MLNGLGVPDGPCLPDQGPSALGLMLLASRRVGGCEPRGWTAPAPHTCWMGCSPTHSQTLSAGLAAASLLCVTPCLSSSHGTGDLFQRTARLHIKCGAHSRC